MMTTMEREQGSNQVCPDRSRQNDHAKECISMVRHWKHDSDLLSLDEGVPRSPMPNRPDVHQALSQDGQHETHEGMDNNTSWCCNHD